MKKKSVISFIVAGILILAGVAVYFGCFYNYSEDCEVIFVPGWKSKNNVQLPVQREIKKIFKTRKISVRHWESNCSWSIAKANSEKEAQTLSEKIIKMPAERQQKLILAGHSLGGRIVARTAQKLNEAKIKVKQVILLGAAINCDDRDLKACSEVSTEPFINVFNRDDNVLKLAYGNLERALAAGYCGIKDPQPNTKQYRKSSGFDNDLANVFEHHVDVYLEFFALIRQNKEVEYVSPIDHHKIKFEETFLSLPPNIYLIAPGSTLEESYHEWKFCYYELFKFSELGKFAKWLDWEKESMKLYLIVGPHGECMWNVNYKMIKQRWDEVKKQINAQLTARKDGVSK